MAAGITVATCTYHQLQALDNTNNFKNAVAVKTYRTNYLKPTVYNTIDYLVYTGYQVYDMYEYSFKRKSNARFSSCRFYSEKGILRKPFYRTVRHIRLAKLSDRCSIWYVQPTASSAVRAYLQ